ncbi:MAG: ribonuclease P protein component [Chthoniobacter sp.]|nr:ribonuclease P protein component [Chthoniobacter sp.]
MPSARLRFPKAARLCRAGEFATLKRDGRSFHGKLMVLSVLKSAAETEARIGLITSRRVGGAVVRVRVRRRLRELVRAARPQMKAGVWLALIARQAAARASFESLRAEWLILAERSSILGPCS